MINSGLCFGVPTNTKLDRQLGLRKVNKGILVNLFACESKEEIREELKRRGFLVG